MIPGRELETRIVSIPILGLLLQPGTWYVPGVVHSSSTAAPLTQPGWTMPGYADPPQPIPYSKPGYPSKTSIEKRTELALTYQPWAGDINRLSPSQTTRALSYGADYDFFTPAGQAKSCCWPVPG